MFCCKNKPNEPCHDARHATSNPCRNKERSFAAAGFDEQCKMSRSSLNFGLGYWHLVLGLGL